MSIAVVFINAGNVRAAQVFTSIDFPGASSTQAYGINASGDIVGLYGNSTGTHGFLLSGAKFTGIDFPGASLTTASGISDRGDIVGWYTATGTHGFLLSKGAFTTIDVPSSSAYGDTNGTWASAINSEGEITGRFQTNIPIVGFLLSKGVFTRFQVLAAVTNPGGINSQADVVGSTNMAFMPPTHGFLLNRKNVVTMIDFPGASSTSASGISEKGNIAGYYLDTARVGHGFVMDAKGNFTTIDVPGAKSTLIYGINARGDIVGAYVDSAGATHGFVQNAQ